MVHHDINNLSHVYHSSSLFNMHHKQQTLNFSEATVSLLCTAPFWLGRQSCPSLGTKILQPQNILTLHFILCRICLLILGTDFYVSYFDSHFYGFSWRIFAKVQGQPSKSLGNTIYFRSLPCHFGFQLYSVRS